MYIDGAESLTDVLSSPARTHAQLNMGSRHPASSYSGLFIPRPLHPSIPSHTDFFTPRPLHTPALLSLDPFTHRPLHPSIPACRRHGGRGMGRERGRRACGRALPSSDALGPPRAHNYTSILKKSIYHYSTLLLYYFTIGELFRPPMHSALTRVPPYY